MTDWLTFNMANINNQEGGRNGGRFEDMPERNSDRAPLKVKSTHPSAETVITCFRSLANFTPVMTSECPDMVAMSSPVLKSRIQTFLSVHVVAA